MTRYTLAWVQSAENELVDLWLKADDRAEITSATSLIDHDLRTDAESKGVEIAEGLRALNVPPLRVIFTVLHDDRIVEVLRVRRI